MRFGVTLAAGLLVLAPVVASAQQPSPPSTSDLADPAFIDNPDLPGTFSVIGRDPATGQLGIAVHSHTLAVGARVRGGRANVAVFAHQSGSDPLYSEIGVPLLQAGWTPQEALDFMVKGDSSRNSRQVAILDMQGRTAAYTSPTISDWKGHKCGVDYCAQGNTLAGPEVVDSMAASMLSSAGKGIPLADRLLNALEAGNRQGGDRRGVESVGILILKQRTQADFGDRELDLRVDDARDPFAEMHRVLNVSHSQRMAGGVGRLIAAKDYAGAIATAKQALELAPTQDGPHMSMAQAYLLQGQKAQALAELKIAVEMNAWNKGQLRKDARFESIRTDPEFLKIVAGPDHPAGGRPTP
jgi:uncharacterized Ntn-hydrolase superfamily protein